MKIEGTLFLIFVLWYSGTRFFLDLFRCSDLKICDPRYWGYTPSQYISLGVFIISLIYLFNIFKNPPAGGKKHMAEQQNDNNGGKANENKDLQGSVVSYTEVEEVIIGGDTGDISDAGSVIGKDKVKDIMKKPWAHLAIALLVLALGALATSAYYNKVYYGEMFKKPLFSFQGKTWVSYDDPIVKLTIVNDPKCETCISEPIVGYFKSGLASTLFVEEINFDSQEGKDLVNKFNIKSVPAFIFGSNVKDLKKLKEAKPEELGQTFIIKDDQYYLKPVIVSSMASEMGIDLGRFISLPKITAEDRIKGPESAPVTIIEFSDFKCPYCKQESGIINQVLADYPGKVRLVYKHLPLPTHPEAQFAAEAAECAGEQGKFFEMADVFFAKQEKLDPVSITNYAWGLKLDVKKFKECTDSGKFKAKIANDSQTAVEFEIGGTPALFIGDKFYGGGLSLEQFKEVIDAKLVK
jgi:predicted DsbA family dithiol-disulfide isomerase